MTPLFLLCAFIGVLLAGLYCLGRWAFRAKEQSDELYNILTRDRLHELWEDMEDRLNQKGRI